MSRRMPVLTVESIQRGMTTDDTEEYEEFLTVTPLEGFFFRIHVDKKPEGDEYFVMGTFTRGKLPPGRTTDFPFWIRIY